MDQPTLTNHIIHLSKEYFDAVSKIVLSSVFHLRVINVDGAHDGGTDFVEFMADTSRAKAAYQITTQKKDIGRKAYKDVKKAIEKLGVNRFFFLTSVNLSEIEARKIEHEISQDLQIQAVCLGAKHIAGFLIEESLVNTFLDKCSYPLPRSAASSPDYREMALHAYTLMSNDARNVKEGIYDDTILFVASETDQINKDELVGKVVDFLKIGDEKSNLIERRIDALFGRHSLIRLASGAIALSESVKSDLQARKRIYDQELSDLAVIQIDLMRTDYNIDWTLNDSKSVCVFIADTYIAEQLKTLREIKASITVNPIFNVEDKGIDNLKRFLAEKKVPKGDIDIVTEKLLKTATAHPVITKLARASVYVALEGASPIASAKALGAARWSDYRIMIEPTVAIPWICSQLYRGDVNRYFDSSIRAVKRAKELDASLHITYYYINECAAHLLRARNYDGLDLNPDELRFSKNAYISNYFSLKSQGMSMPGSILMYLRTFSPAVLVERHDKKEWVRAIMTDLQGILTRSSIDFVETPKYEHNDCAEIEREYAFNIHEYKIDKPKNLIDHDICALQFINDMVKKKNEHWLMLTYDRSAVDVSAAESFAGWVTTPARFLELTEYYKPLEDARYVSLVHNFATYSEKTLSAAARVIDKIVQYASTEMQNWEFRRDFDEFKKDLISKTDLNALTAYPQIDLKTDEFLTAHGIEIKVKKKDDLEPAE